MSKKSRKSNWSVGSLLRPSKRLSAACRARKGHEDLQPGAQGGAFHVPPSPSLEPEEEGSEELRAPAAVDFSGLQPLAPSAMWRAFCLLLLPCSADHVATRPQGLQGRDC